MSAQFDAPKIPHTPSENINKMLKTRCDKKFDSPVKYGIAQWICTVFGFIVTVYNLIHKDKSRHSHTHWMLSCGLVIAAVVLAVYLGYHSALSVIYAIYSIIYYIVVFFNNITLFIGGLLQTLFKTASYGVALGTMALCVAGMAFFDKGGDVKKEMVEEKAPYESEKKDI